MGLLLLDSTEHSVRSLVGLHIIHHYKGIKHDLTWCIFWLCFRWFLQWKIPARGGIGKYAVYQTFWSLRRALSLYWLLSGCSLSTSWSLAAWSKQKMTTCPKCLLSACIHFCSVDLSCWVSTFCLVTFSRSDTSVNRITAHVVMGISGGFVLIAVVANLYTISKVCTSLMFSQRRKLQLAISNLETVKSEGFLQALRKEVALMTDMVIQLF